MSSNTARKIFNAALALVILYEWSLMFSNVEENMLTVRGIASLKYFTILSNLLEGIACFVWLISRNEKIKYVAAVSVMLTFVTVMVFLGPTMGYAIMFVGPSLWFHLIVPLLALLEVVFWNRESFSARDNLIAVLPMAVYGFFYVANNIINGVGEWPHINDWYGFLAWGYPIGVVIYLVIIMVTWLIGFVIRKAKDRLK